MQFIFFKNVTGIYNDIISTNKQLSLTKEVIQSTALDQLLQQGADQMLFACTSYQ